MAAVTTIETGLARNFEFASLQARGYGIAFGTIALTYSGTGGISATMPFNNIKFCALEHASGYMFEWRTTGMVLAYHAEVTTTAAGNPTPEVASDTDFTGLAEGGIHFMAIGYD